MRFLNPNEPALGLGDDSVVEIIEPHGGTMNPATGLYMPDINGLDTLGNPYGIDLHDSPWEW